MAQSVVVDLILIIFLLLYLIDGYRRGFLMLIFELLGTVASFYLAWLWGAKIGEWIAEVASFAAPAQRLIGFIAVWLILQLLYLAISTFVYPKIPPIIRFSLANRLLGLFPSLGKGLIVAAICLTLMVILPIKWPMRTIILNSALGGPLVAKTQQWQQKFVKTYSEEITQTLTFLTTTPIVRRTDEKHETLSLHFKTSETTIDTRAQQLMLDLVNKERISNNLPALTASETLRAVAKAHGEDMLAQGYFSHYSLDGKDPFDRMDEAKISYLTAGENLAFAPTVQLAHSGLMNSPKHRDNILFPKFGRVGIAAIDAGFYGMMFVQVFSD